MKSYLKRPEFIYLIISFTIVFTLIREKYLFLLDHVPKMNNYGFLVHFYGLSSPVYGGSLPLSFISCTIPAEIFQKVFLFLILFLSAYSMHSLVSKVTESKTARFYAGLLYMLNPYTYIRIVVGHWLILFAYAVLPLALKAFLELLDKRDRKSLAKAVLLTSLVAFNSHTLFIAFLIFGIILSFKLYKEKSLSLIKTVLLAFIIFFILNSYWIAPALIAKEETLIAHISSEDLAIFAPKIESFSALFTLASMHGFWRPAYIYAKDFIPFWQLLFVVILFLAIHGFVSYYRDKRLGIYVKAFFAIWIVGLILAAGIRSPFAGFFEFLFDHIPLIKGMRDTHKFVTMLVLAYACLGALGLAEIEKSLKRPIARKTVAVFLVVPLIYSFTFFNGFAGQIKATDYPKDWYEVNEFLSKDKDEFKVLFFPWHLYMDFHWVPNKDKRIANPAPNFFDKEVISAKNIEAGSIYRQVFTPMQLYIDNLLANRDKIDNFGELVSILNVKYILLTKEADYKNYFFLFNQSDLELVMETDNFYVFKNKAYVSKIFSVDSRICVKDMEEFLELSREVDIRKVLVIVNESCGKELSEEGFKELKYRKVNPVKYVIEDKPLKYIIFAEEYHKSWKLNGKEPIKAYNAVNAWEADKESLEIEYERFYKIYMPAYIISITMLLFLLAILIKGSKSFIKLRK